MSGLEEPANAKINLALDVLRKREDGYHELEMIMQTIGLHDTIRIDAISGGEGISLDCGGGLAPKDSANTAWKAAELLMRRYCIKSHVRISITKRIPAAAGLAGGSADAAAVLRGLNKLFSLNIAQSELKEIAGQIGADVPFCIEGGTKFAQGIGEHLTLLPDFSGVDIVLIRPKIRISTGKAFGRLDVHAIADEYRPDMVLLKKALIERDIVTIAGKMKNVFEHVTIPQYGIVSEAKMRLAGAGALGSVMSGSGPSVFGIFSDSDTAASACGLLAADNRWQCFCTKTTGEVN